MIPTTVERDENFRCLLFFCPTWLLLLLLVCWFRLISITSCSACCSVLLVVVSLGGGDGNSDDDLFCFSSDFLFAHSLSSFFSCYLFLSYLKYFCLLPFLLQVTESLPIHFFAKLEKLYIFCRIFFPSGCSCFVVVVLHHFLYPWLLLCGYIWDTS